MVPQVAQPSDRPSDRPNDRPPSDRPSDRPSDQERYTDDLDSRVRLVAAAYVLLLRERADQGFDSERAEVLLHLRRGTGYRDGHWALLAGHVNDDESVPEAAVREAWEEIGVRIGLDDLVPLTAMHRTLRGGGPREQRIDVFFAARRWSGRPRVLEPAKNAGLCWWPLAGVVAGLSKPCVPHELAVLELVAAGASPGTLPAVLTHGF